MRKIHISEMIVITMFVVGLGTAMMHRVNDQALSSIEVVEVAPQQEIVVEPAS